MRPAVRSLSKAESGDGSKYNRRTRRRTSLVMKRFKSSRRPGNRPLTKPRGQHALGQSAIYAESLRPPGHQPSDYCITRWQLPRGIASLSRPHPPPIASRQPRGVDRPKPYSSRNPANHGNSPSPAKLFRAGGSSCNSYWIFLGEECEQSRGNLRGLRSSRELGK